MKQIKKFDLSKIILNRDNNEIACSNVKFFDNNSNTYPESTDLLCLWDGCKFENSPIGIPLRPHIDENPSDNEICYDAECVFCSFECCYAYLIDHFEKMECKRDINYKNSIQYLKYIFNKIYPNKTLKKAHDKRLVKESFGGSITIADFRNNNNTFDRTSNIKLYNASIKYQ